jgi:hypothetical protein
MYGMSVKHCNYIVYTYSYSLSLVSLPVNGSTQDTKKRKQKYIASQSVSKVNFCRNYREQVYEGKQLPYTVYLLFVVLAHHLKRNPTDGWLKVRLLCVHHNAYIQICCNLAMKGT